MHKNPASEHWFFKTTRGTKRNYFYVGDTIKPRITDNALKSYLLLGGLSTRATTPPFFKNKTGFMAPEVCYLHLWF